MIVAEKLDVVAKQDYEVRWLQIPAIYVQAVWLKDLVGSDDRIIPFHVQPPLRKNFPYLVNEFLWVVRDMAKTRLAFSDEPS